jgi:hypothetical protein
MAGKRKPQLDRKPSKVESDTWKLSPRQILIQKLNMLLYAAQINRISDVEANELLRILSHM